MASHKLKKNGVNFKIDLSWKPATFTSPRSWSIKLSYFCGKIKDYRVILSDDKNDETAKKNMEFFLERNRLRSLPEAKDYEKAKLAFFENDVKNIDFPKHFLELIN